MSIKVIIMRCRSSFGDIDEDKTSKDLILPVRVYRRRGSFSLDDDRERRKCVGVITWFGTKRDHGGRTPRQFGYKTGGLGPS
ncbi:hypothetical protein TWF788_008214 [Orbilia oligospora]|uniref:Uncharacterized protein n=1 Tax=Orbilia oligospora TaxID=2813651 RepID=A0A7C8Q2U6_ORBOL|nr:hypothetical protein TWF788_008214 [Orbilia oligospora]